MFDSEQSPRGMHGGATARGAVSRVDEDDGDVGGRRAGHHVARVLHVPGVSAMTNERSGVEK
jgi:hypothetical protein